MPFREETLLVIVQKSQINPVLDLFNCVQDLLLNSFTITKYLNYGEKVSYNVGAFLRMFFILFIFILSLL